MSTPSGADEKRQQLAAQKRGAAGLASSQSLSALPAIKQPLTKGTTDTVLL